MKVSGWQRRAFLFAVYASAQFVLLTVLAMALYPGGTTVDPAARGYDFFRNFFSDLGMQRSHSGALQPAPAGLFFVSLSTAGVALILFSLAFRAFFKSRAGRVLATGGALAGVVAGLGYVGVALTPADLRLDAHMLAVYVAFLAFPLSTACYAMAVYGHRRFPNRYGHVLLLFTVLLIIYLGFLFGGLGTGTDQALAIQATAQKTIVYAAIVTLLVTASGAYRRSRPATEAAT